MVKIQNSGFEPFVQKLDVQHPAYKGFRSRKSRRQHESHEPAFRHPYHTGTYRKGSRRHLPVRNDHIQQPDRTLSVVQISPSKRNGTAGHQLF